MTDDLPDLANFKAFNRGLAGLAEKQLNRFWMEHRYSGNSVLLHTDPFCRSLSITIERDDDGPTEFLLCDDDMFELRWLGTKGPEGQDTLTVVGTTFRELVQNLISHNKEQKLTCYTVPDYVLNLVQQIGGEVGYRGMFRHIDEP